MGARALVAYEQPDGRYKVHYSHWGASNLKLRRPLTQGADPGEEGIDSEIWLEGVTLRELAHEHLDYIDKEALYVVPMQGDARAFVTLAFVRALEGRDRDRYHDGALYEPRWVGNEPVTHFTSRFRGYCNALEEDHAAGRRDTDATLERLERWVFGEQGGGNPGRIPKWSPRAYLPPGADGRVSDVLHGRGESD
jgi:hypothetical protein